MSIKRTASIALLGVSAAALLSASAMAATAPANDTIGGTVMGANGPEAGVWVIAQTNDLPTKFVKIVATDDQGRFMLPQMPKAHYFVWVRGYGLVDSAPVKADTGATLALKSVQAPNRAAAAQYYPGVYWYSMLKIPPASMFPGTGPTGNGLPTSMIDQGLWLRYVKTDGCVHCHQIGDLATRTLPANLGTFKTSAEAWERRLQSGQASSTMVGTIGDFGAAEAEKMFGDWTDRVAKGELPKDTPPRPVGMERNVVITEWDWGSPTNYMHDSISTDKRNPTVNAHGIIYGAPEASSDMVPWLDPVDNTSGFLKSQYRDPKTPTTKTDAIYAPSPYYGTETIWDSHTNIHNPMFDEKARLWLTARIRPANVQPAYCKAGSDQPSAKVYPKNTSARQVEVYDPKTQKISMIDLCFNTHHLQFDKDDVLWFSAGGTYDVVGWLDVKKWDATHDDKASQGWAPFVIDTNGNGKRDLGWNEPGKPVDPTKDTRIVAGLYGVGPNPADGTIWGSVTGFPGGVVRYDPKTQLSEYYEFPFKNKKVSKWGFSPRGSDISSDGVLWSVLSSGDLASFDRRLCKGKLSGPALADPQNLCPEGFRIYQMPGPSFDLPKGTTGATAEAPYYVWVDQHNILGLGANVPIATGNNGDSLNALVNGKWVVMRIPYPMSFFAKNLDGRIDEPKDGWKGKGLWSQYSDRSAPHIEGGKGQRSKVVHVQYRPDPLAK